ncbi:Ankyrin repeat-containing protein [Artemisia annua]|uniref:Ankyrin repeat-containing protein n=1 Tax=Artemisia annua TaxID=35608 RepID=A0A2U1LH20_ARTAN|nr:Ankyrin repeat-containing protein [Artemisia annua]
MSLPGPNSGGSAIPLMPINHTVVSIGPSPTQPPTPPPAPPPLNLPLQDLFQGSRENYVTYGVPLYEASIKGDWKAAEAILKEKPELIRSAITENGETPLHIAASAESSKDVEKFVENLVSKMDVKDLELQNKNSNTALSLAAAAGNVKTAMIMVKKNKNVLELPGNNNTMPLYMAALFARSEMVRYLYDNSKKMVGDYWSHDNRGWVLQKCVEAEIFDVALDIVRDRPELTAKKGLLTDVLSLLAQKRKAFKNKKPNNILRGIRSFFGVFHLKVGPADKESEALQLLRILWKCIATKPKSEIDDIIRGQPVRHQNGSTKYPSRVLFVAAKEGNSKFIIELIKSYPDLIWKQDDKGQTIFHVAVKRRHAKIYNLLYEIGAMKDLITPIKDKDSNNMLHLVAKSGKQKRYQKVSGVALQMQRELLWFKEVKQMIPPSYRLRKNLKGDIPQDLFTKTHYELVKQGEGWMKDTASQCMVVATLIATIAFAAAFTLPGSYNQDTGIPFFRQKPSLIVFVISDAVSLIFSSTSVLIFLAILTSRYAEDDFVKSLPNKLMSGLTSLFLSIVTMMIAFSASFFVLYHENLKWVPITVTCMAGIPVVLFAILQFRLLKDVYKSTHQSMYLFNPKKRSLYLK